MLSVNEKCNLDFCADVFVLVMCVVCDGGFVNE